MAVAMPSGTTITAQMTIRYSVPKIADWMPEFAGMIRDGKLVRKSHERSGDAVARDVEEQRRERERR